MATVAFFMQLLKTSIRACISRRKAFVIESTSILVNNLIFFAIWWIFFRQFHDVAGWSFYDMTVLIAVGCGGYGLMQICFGGIKDLSKMIIDGDLDPFMTQPKNLLLHIAGSKSRAKGWGNLMTSCFLIAFGGTTPSTFPLMLICIICAGLVFISINVIAHSLPFWLGSIEAVSKKYCDSLFLFALYPSNIYSGFLQIIMFTLIPAGIIGYLPVELFRNFSWLMFFLLIVSAVCFVALAFLVFYAGLRRYESGNRFGMRL